VAKRGGAFHNSEPEQAIPANAPREAVKAEFGRRMQHRMAEHGWTQSDLAREAARYMPDKKFNRDNVSNYVRGMAIPGPLHLAALAKAFKCDKIDLLPSRGTPSVDDKTPPLDVRDGGDGRAWLRINQSVDWPIALKILALLKVDD
jgi:transcriptional regulator with XRE-family HTH domain